MPGPVMWLVGKNINTIKQHYSLKQGTACKRHIGNGT